jgi:zinc protease
MIDFRRFAALAVLLVAAAAGPAEAANKVERVISPGGIEAWLIRDATIPIVAIEIGFSTGAALDPADRTGLSRMAVSLLDEGAGDLDSQAFQGRLEDLASRISFNATLDTITGSVSTLKEKLGDTLELLRLSITRPRFDPGDVDRIRSQLLVSLSREAEDPNGLATRTWFRANFPGHPYGRGSRGSAAGLRAVTPDELKGWVRQRLTLDRLKIGVAGDVDPAELGPLLDRTFGALPRTADRPVVPDVVPQAAGGDVMVVQKPLPQTVVMLGGVGVSRTDPDYYAAFVVNYVLGGGGFTSRLTEEVREKRGLAYSVYSSLSPLDHAALLFGGTATQSARVGESLKIIRDVWAEFGRGGPTEKELADAKTYLTGSFPLRLDSTGRIASTLASMQLEELGIDYLDTRNAKVEAVTMADARRVAARLFDPARLSTVMVGAPAGVTATRPLPPEG